MWSKDESKLVFMRPYFNLLLEACSSEESTIHDAVGWQRGIIFSA